MICTILASSAVCKFRNSPIHYIKLNTASRGFDVRSLQNLAKLFMQSKEKTLKTRERDKSYKGRKISNFHDKDASISPDNVNFIKFSNKKTNEIQKIRPKIFMDEIKDNEIYRPKLNFTSNAKPELLKYRDVQIDKKTILKKPTKELRRLNKKYSGKVPFHFGYSRKFQDFPVGKSFQKTSYQKTSFPSASSSSLTWLSKPRLGNGLPTSILHMKYPVKITKLSSGERIRSNRSKYFSNFI